jgi:alpha-beta hydrolase superfamily lysophospholipase
LIPSLETLISDNSKFLEELSLFYSNLPIYITGGSLGGALCFALSFKYPELVKGIIALNPAISGFIKCEKFLRCLLSCFSKCCPALKLSKRDPRTFCKNEEIIRYSSENTLNYSGKVRLGTASTIGNLMNYVRRRPHLVKCNVLIIVGLEDTIVNPKETEEFYLRLSVKYKDFWIYDDIEHAIVYSPKIYQICERIAGWMLEILKISKD